jgi:hypothetical protein
MNKHNILNYVIIILSKYDRKMPDMIEEQSIFEGEGLTILPEKGQIFLGDTRFFFS